MALNFRKGSSGDIAYLEGQAQFIRPRETVSGAGRRTGGADAACDENAGAAISAGSAARRAAGRRISSVDIEDTTW
jgi:hypothetical protein